MDDNDLSKLGQVAFDSWLDSLSEGWWDDAADGGEILDTLQDAFKAGWDARAASIRETL